jgi:hypothetical protein
VLGIAVAAKITVAEDDRNDCDVGYRHVRIFVLLTLRMGLLLY